jgi:hypothetical protein
LTSFQLKLEILRAIKFDKVSSTAQLLRSRPILKLSMV